MSTQPQVLQKEIQIKTAMNLNKYEEGCISYLHGARGHDAEMFYRDVG